MTQTRKTGDALTALAREHQRPWRDVITDWANQGYTWADVADILQVNTEALKAYCYYRDIRFPWQGMSSPILRDRARRYWKDRGMGGAIYAPRHTVRGVTGTMGELARHFGINKNTVWTRIYRKGMSLEDALTTPVKTPQQIGDTGQAALKRNGTRSDYWKKEGQLNYAKAPSADTGL